MKLHQEKPADFYDPSEVLRDLQQNVGFFKPNNFLRLGSADSGHHVQFGTLDPYGDVAVKPFTTLQSARREAGVLEYTRNQGFLIVEPLEIARGGLYTYLITKYDKNLRNLGQVDWRSTVASTRMHKILTPLVNYSGQYLGALHAKSIAHGDAQIKNILLRPDGTPVIGDMENAQINLQKSELNYESVTDLSALAQSLRCRGLLYDKSYKYQAAYFLDNLFEPAVEVIGDILPVEEADKRRDAFIFKTTEAFHLMSLFENGSFRKKLGIYKK